MRFDVITLFPAIFPGPLKAGVVGRALDQGLIEIEAHDLRQWGLGVHRQVDDIPYGGGPGMVLRPEPLFEAVRVVREAVGPPQPRGVLLSAHGRRLTTALVEELALEPKLLMVCGRYEGVDERVRAGLQLDEISVGDFVVSGGELPAMMLIEAVARRVPGTLGDPESALDESFSEGLPEYPHYTRPAVFEGMEVPEVLRSGDHAKIANWRAEAAMERARRLRPDLLDGTPRQRAVKPAAREVARGSGPAAAGVPLGGAE
ncbi:MAG TPA: tRNA (guanosine(37)-N1)-methyltransferase TrmD [Candidatus Dormibacteraeota bacterium]|nr:tRNA (guanosine(37)-N1)-methyltransferase TrmD [Candidatus Dormibacteraeota bacterium]